MTLLRVTMVEMRRALHRRLVRWMIVLALACCAFVGVIAFTTSSDPAKLALEDEHPANMFDWWHPDGGGGFLAIAASFLAIGAAICGASVAGAEWKAGTITTVLTWVPSRVRLHIARTLSAALLAFVIGFLLQVVFLGAALPAVLAHGTTGGVDGEWWASLVAAMLRISMIGALMAVLALSIATIGRNTAAALVTLSIWALIIEGLIRGYKPGLARFLVAENVVTVVSWARIDDVEFDRGPVLALSTLTFYLGAIAVVAGLTFWRRDVAAAT